MIIRTYSTQTHVPLMKKPKHKRKTRATRHIEQIEALMLGDPVPEPTRWLCSHWTHARLMEQPYDELGRIAGSLGVYKQDSRYWRRKLRPRHVLVREILRYMDMVPLDSAPGTIEGLLALGTDRLRYLAGLCILNKNANGYFVRRKRRKRRKFDLTDEELARRVLRDLRLFTPRCERPDRLSPEDYLPEESAPPVAPSAKAARLLARQIRNMGIDTLPSQGRSHRRDALSRPGRSPLAPAPPGCANATHLTGKKYKKHPNSNCGKCTRVTDTLRCGCVVDRTHPLSKTGHFRVRSTLSRCILHQATAEWPGLLHRRALRRTPTQRRQLRRQRGHGAPPWRRLA